MNKLYGSRLPSAIISLLSLTLYLFARPVSAAPARLNCAAGNAAITAPQSGAVLSGVVQIEGTASLGSAFQYYKVEFSPAGQDAYTVFSGLVRQPVVNGQLAVWDSAGVPDGTYAIRLRVVDTTGNYCEVVVSGLHVSNSSPATPTEQPTPAETEAAPQFAVVPTAVPTIQIPVVTEVKAIQEQTPRAPAGGTRTPASGPALPAVSVDSLTSTLGEMFGGFLRAFIFGAIVMAGIFVLVGVVFFVRRVL